MKRIIFRCAFPVIVFPIILLAFYSVLGFSDEISNAASGVSYCISDEKAIVWTQEMRDVAHPVSLDTKEG